MCDLLVGMKTSAVESVCARDMQAKRILQTARLYFAADLSPAQRPLQTAKGDAGQNAAASWRACGPAKLHMPLHPITVKHSLVRSAYMVHTGAVQQCISHALVNACRYATRQGSFKAAELA